VNLGNLAAAIGVPNGSQAETEEISASLDCCNSIYVNELTTYRLECAKDIGTSSLTIRHKAITLSTSRMIRFSRIQRMARRMDGMDAEGWSRPKCSSPSTG